MFFHGSSRKKCSWLKFLVFNPFSIWQIKFLGQDKWKIYFFLHVWNMNEWDKMVENDLLPLSFNSFRRMKKKTIFTCRDEWIFFMKIKINVKIIFYERKKLHSQKIYIFLKCFFLKLLSTQENIFFMCQTEWKKKCSLAKQFFSSCVKHEWMGWNGWKFSFFKVLSTHKKRKCNLESRAPDKKKAISLPLRASVRWSALFCIKLFSSLSARSNLS